MKNIKEILKELIDPPKTEYFELALIHKSYYHENKDITFHNELLEILGDALLEAIIVDYLLEKFPNTTEGIITVIKTGLVNEMVLSEIFEELELKRYIKLGKGEEETGGREKPKIKAGCFEAIIGALYKSFGWDKTKEIVREIYKNRIENIKDWRDFLDPKSKLQHFVQKRKLSYPEYKVIKSSGPDHDKRFTVEVSIGEEIKAIGEGTTKKKAQQQAAKKLLEIIGEKEDVSK